MQQDYSRLQLHLIGRALLEFHRLGSGVPGKTISWPKIVSQVAIYTDLEVEEIGAAGDAALVARNSATLRQTAERFRQFAQTATQGDASTGVREIGDIPYIVEFLTHPEVGMLTPEALANPEVSLEPARQFAEFVWDLPYSEHKPERVLSGTYLSRQAGHVGDEVVRLTFDEGIANSFCGVAMSIFHLKTGKHLSILHGWAVFLPDRSTFIALKPETTKETVFYSGYIEDDFDDDDSCQILLRGLSAFPATPATLNVVDRYVASKMPADSNIENVIEAELRGSLKRNISIFLKVENFDLRFSELRDTIETGVTQDIRRITRVPISEITMIEGQIDRTTVITSSQNELFEAIDNCDIAAFAASVVRCEDINVRDPRTLMTPLHIVAALGRREELRLLAQHGSLRYCVRDAKGRLPSYLASKGNVDPVITRYLEIKEAAEGAQLGFAPTILRDLPFRAPS